MCCAQVARTTGATSTGTATSITSHTYLLSLMSQYGFCGSIGRSIIVPFSSICHISLFAGHAYFNSPRGRWALDCLSHGLFLVLFHIALFEPKGWERQPRSQQRNGLPWDERPGIAAWTPEAMNATESNTYVMYIVFGLFLFWVLSLGIDLFNICIFQFGGSFHRFLKMESFTMKMDVLQFVTLVASTMLWGLVEMATAGTISNFDQVWAPPWQAPSLIFACMTPAQLMIGHGRLPAALNRRLTGAPPPPPPPLGRFQCRQIHYER